MPQPNPISASRGRDAQRVPGPGAVSGSPSPKPVAVAEAEALPSIPRPEPPAIDPAPGPPAAGTFSYWNQFFARHPTTPLDLKLYLDTLRKKRRFKDIEAALRGYLRHLPKGTSPQFWMYGELALTIRINRGTTITPADLETVKDALGRSALLAIQDGNPNFILSAADEMLSFNTFEVRLNEGGKPTKVAVNDLIDKVAQKVPHRAEPLLLSLDVARRTLDPKRMASSAEALLSLGWPRSDDLVRTEVHKQVDELVEDLRDEKREAEADELEGMLPGALGRDLLIRLTWEGNAGLDLLVDEPLGATASHNTPRTVFGGALIQEGRGKDRTDVYVCPRAFPGDYTIRVQSLYQDPTKPVTSARLEIITRDGLPESKADRRTIDLKAPAPSSAVTTKSALPALPRSTPVVVHLESGRRKVVLPYTSARVEPAAIVIVPTGPSLTPTQPAGAVPQPTTNPSRVRTAPKGSK